MRTSKVNCSQTTLQGRGVKWEGTAISFPPYNIMKSREPYKPPTGWPEKNLVAQTYSSWCQQTGSLSIAKGRIPSRQPSKVQVWLAAPSSIDTEICPPRQGRWHRVKNPYFIQSFPNIFSLKKCCCVGRLVMTFTL